MAKRISKLIREIALLSCLSILVCLFIGTRDVNAAKKVYGYLYFYTLDSEEIPKLKAKVLVGQEFTFPDPDKYKYNGYKDGEGKIVYNEHNSEVTGIEWVKLDKDGNPTTEKYQQGDKYKVTEGETMFRVGSDDPALTQENLMTTNSKDHVFLTFYSQNGNEIESLATELFKTEVYEFLDPDEYTDVEGPLTGKGIYWCITDENDKKYLVNKGDRKTFEPGYYDVRIITDDPVKVRFYYPESADGESTLQNPNTGAEVYSMSLYDEYEAKVGDTIHLYKSLGTLAMDQRVFKGWSEDHEEGDKLYAGGSSFKIMENYMDGLGFRAYYEVDENFDPYAKDENGKEIEKDPDKVFIDVQDINDTVGHGYQAYIDSTGKIQRKTTATKINNDVVVYGTPGKIKERKDFTSLKEGGDKNNAKDYKLDKYGNKIEESPLKDTLAINDVLRQDDAAMYMDIIGNSMIYYSNLTPEHRIELAYRRYSAAQTESFATLLKNWDKETTERYIAIEFALLKGTYPSEGEDLIKDVADEYKSGDKIIWKNSYLMESAYKKLLPLKKIWTGWMDTYTDGLYEEYLEKEGKGGGNVKDAS